MQGKIADGVGGIEFSGGLKSNAQPTQQKAI